MAENLSFEFQEKTNREQFERFHEAHPQVFVEFIRRSRIAKERGLKKCGAWLIWGGMRWFYQFESDEEFKLNNNYIAHYARLAMQQCPDLAEFFNLRRLRKA